MPPRLPPELLPRVLSTVDPAQIVDRRLLARVARSSRELYDLAMPLLYRELEFDDLRLLDFLACGRQLTRRDPEWGLFTAKEESEYPEEEMALGLLA
ncbi:hypothetical protein A1Q2_04183 [Trichosporon asahii var. asahii CBS 8904]|uniref:F-box domain-containing protein n=1 Tax=Trichosporon asahii var. asahii (strain CBS 8904) TaxID=1220162 RepID=K1VQG1_TRIAC|nr:hypothetical protein A1Q2_04183 [Trichosporon asahii var. asahii CBS 8904]